MGAVYTQLTITERRRIERWRHAKAPVKPDNLHRALNVEPDRLAEVLCWRDTR